MTEYDLLLQSLSRFPSKEWLNGYFDLLKQLLTYFEITANDPRICLSLRTEGGLPVNFGQRYVLEPFRNERIGIIVTRQFPIPATGKMLFAFRANRVVEAHFISIPFKINKPMPATIYKSCITACNRILLKTKKSGFRKYHSSLLYDFTMEPIVRNEVLDEWSPKKR